MYYYYEVKAERDRTKLTTKCCHTDHAEEN